MGVQWEGFIALDKRRDGKVIYLPYVIKYYFVKTCDGMETRLQALWH
jgi:hypothetical protein